MGILCTSVRMEYTTLLLKHFMKDILAEVKHLQPSQNKLRLIGYAL